MLLLKKKKQNKTTYREIETNYYNPNQALLPRTTNIFNRHEEYLPKRIDLLKEN